MASDALVLADIDAFYADSHVLHRVSFRCGEGRLLGLLGRNGAGKTTSMNVTMGVLPPRRGSVEIYGTPVAGRTARSPFSTPRERFAGVVGTLQARSRPEPARATRSVKVPPTSMPTLLPMSPP